MIGLNGKIINLGYFSDFDRAVKCRVDAEHKYFKDYRAINEKEVGEV